jgi:hypothetical protein
MENAHKNRYLAYSLSNNTSSYAVPSLSFDIQLDVSLAEYFTALTVFAVLNMNLFPLEG